MVRHLLRVTYNSFCKSVKKFINWVFKIVLNWKYFLGNDETRLQLQGSMSVKNMAKLIM